ncbi:MAG: type IV secretory system conjugative DNA transfer family protein [Legionella sp.]|nr:type IV secretory system conjugative DNA transfer family protein [Legionella sp.]
MARLILRLKVKLVMDKVHQIIKYFLMIILVIHVLLYLWGLGFFYVEELPLLRVTPWTIPTLMMHYDRFDFLTNCWLFSPLVMVGLMGGLTIAAWVTRSPHQTLYGNAQFATAWAIKRAGYFKPHPQSILIGKAYQRPLYFKLTNHALVFAPSRSGKGVSLVIPNALHWQGSLIVTDNKYEVFQVTSGYRKAMGQAVYRFSPASPDFKTHCINPLDYVSKDNLSRAIGDLQMILGLLLKDAKADNPMWIEEARSLALGILLWLRESDRPFTLGEFAAIVKDGEALPGFLQAIIDDTNLDYNPTIFLSFRNFLGKAVKEQSGVRSTITAMLGLWDDPFVCAATAKSDVDFRDFRKKPSTLYLSFGTDQIARLSPLISLVIQLFLNSMLKALPDENEPHKVLVLLDEFTRFGRMEKLKDGFGDLAGYGVHLMPIIQNVGQFYEHYSRDGSDIFFQNTDVKVVFRQEAQTDRRLVSDALGTRTVRVRTHSTTTHQFHATVNESFVERPLLTPQEIGKLCSKTQIVITSHLAMKANKRFYYEEKTLQKKCLKPLDIPLISPTFPTVVKNTKASSGDKPSQSQSNVSELVSNLESLLETTLEEF